MAEVRNIYSILKGKPEVRDHSDDLRAYWKIILEWILGEQGRKLLTGFIWLWTGTSDGFF
jgi:hypothetical protein